MNQNKKLINLAKKIVKKETLSKLKLIEIESEQNHALKYSLVSSLEREFHALQKKARFFDHHKNIFFVQNKLLLVPSKIKHFAVECDEAEFYKVLKLLEEIKKELSNVESTKYI